MRYFNSYKLLLLACFFWFLQNPALAEDALEDTNHVPSLLGDYGVITKRIMADANGNLYVNTIGNSGYTKVIDNITLNNVITSTTSVATNISGRNKIAFLISYDETEADQALSGKFTIEVSTDNSIWIDYDIIFDSNGTGTPQSLLEFTVDDEDVCYFPQDFTAQYIRVTFTGTNTNATNTELINVWVCYQ